MASGNVQELTEGLLEVLQAGHLGGHVVQVGLEGPAHQQGVGQVRDVDAHDGEGETGQADTTMLRNNTNALRIMNNEQDPGLRLIAAIEGTENIKTTQERI